MHNKAQSAVEFISAYGFSFLLIIIAISVLFLFTTLPKKVLPNYCGFFGGFTCADVLFTNTSTGSTLLVAAIASQPGIVNSINFTATLNYQHSTNGFCTPSFALPGQRIYCIANFTMNGTYGTPYVGTFSVQANYCSNSPGNISNATCLASNAYNFSGNVRVGMSKVILGSNHTLSITLDNTQGQTVPAHFQQEIQFAPSAYQLYERSDLGNIRFYYKNRELYSWCQTNCVSTSTSNAIFWIQLPVAVPGGASRDITMYILPRSVTYGDGFAGEAPQLSTSYGQYDNGVSVFNYYDNFATNTLGSYTTSGTGATYSVSSGLVITHGTCGQNGVIAPTSQTPSTSYVVGIYGEIRQEFCGGDAWLGTLGYQNTKASANTGYVAQFGVGSGVQDVDVEKFTVSHLATTANAFSLLTFYPLEGSFSSGNTISTLNNGASATSTDTTYKNGYFGIRAYDVDATIKYIYIRQYPPNGIMPSYTLGSLV